MAADRSLFEEYHPVASMTVTIGDGSEMVVAGKGKVALSLGTEGKTTRVTLVDVLYVPKLAVNLFSVSKAAERGVATRFTKSGCDFLDGRGKTVASASRRKGLYVISCQPILGNGDSGLSTGTGGSTFAMVSVSADTDTWYRRLCHQSTPRVKELASAVEGMRIQDREHSASVCEPCIKGKQHKIAHTSSDKV